MKLKLYATKDQVAGYYMGPVALHNDQEALRTIKYTCENWNDVYKDYQLYYLGEYDLETGRIYANKETQFVCNFIEFKPKKKEIKNENSNEPKSE